MSPRPGVYMWSHGGGGVHFHRMAEPIRVLKRQGHNAEVGNRLDDSIAEQYDTIVVHMLHEERESQAWEKLAKNGQHRMVYDVDDAMWEPDWKPFKDAFTPYRLQTAYRNIHISHVVTTPSPVIAEYLTRFNSNVWVVPNTIPEVLLKNRMRDHVRPVIGYQGSVHHVTDVSEPFLRQLRDFLRKFPEWQLKVWGAEPKDISPMLPHGQVIHVPWEPNVRRYYRSLSMDIGLGPLRPTPFNAAKSDLRAREYQAAGIVPVLQDYDPYNKGVLLPGRTGFLVPYGGYWLGPLSVLAEDPRLRSTMAFDGRLWATRFTTESSINAWTTAWDSV